MTSSPEAARSASEKLTSTVSTNILRIRFISLRLRVSSIHDQWRCEFNSQRCALNSHRHWSWIDDTLNLKEMNRIRRMLVLTVLVSFSLALRAASGEDVIIADFEGNDYGAWKATGTAFRRGPAHGPQLGQLEVENARGRGVASSEMEGDGPT